MGRRGGGECGDVPWDGGTGAGAVVWNRLGFTLRSVVQRMRGVRVGGIDETVDQL